MNGKGTMGWCHGFKLHFTCNDTGEIISFCLTGANVDDKSGIVWNVLAKDLYGKLFADRGYLSQNLFNTLFADRVNWVMGLRCNMKNRLMPFFLQSFYNRGSKFRSNRWYNCSRPTY